MWVSQVATGGGIEHREAVSCVATRHYLTLLLANFDHRSFLLLIKSVIASKAEPATSRAGQCVHRAAKRYGHLENLELRVQFVMTCCKVPSPDEVRLDGKSTSGFASASLSTSTSKAIVALAPSACSCRLLQARPKRSLIAEIASTSGANSCESCTCAPEIRAAKEQSVLIHNDVRVAVEYATISRVLPTCSLRKRQNAGSANASSITHDLAVLTKPMQVCCMNMLLNKHSHSFVNATPASRALPKSS
jgi:hypothetical protein